MAKKVEIKFQDERRLVRSAYRSVRCRLIDKKQGFAIFYIDKKKQKHVIATSKISAADAWYNAAQMIEIQVVKKLES